MKVSFFASDVAAGLFESGVIVVQLTGDQHYMTFQRVAEEPRFSGIHFECDGQGWGAYDVVQEVVIGAASLRVQLIPCADREFDGRTQYEIALQIADSQWAELSRWLERVFLGTGLLRFEDRRANQSSLPTPV
jgi:hypothetical protein